MKKIVNLKTHLKLIFAARYYVSYTQGLVITRLHDYQFLFVVLHGSFFLESFGISKQLHFLLESQFLTPSNRLHDSLFDSF